MHSIRNARESKDSGLLTMHEISAQSVQPFPKYEKGGTSACARIQMYPIMTCVICIATWAANTHQIWSQPAEQFLSYSLAANFETLHAARVTRQTGPTNEPNPAVSSSY